MGSRLVSLRYRCEPDHVPMHGDGTGDQPGCQSGLGPLLRKREDIAGCEGMRASLSGDRAGREVRLHRPGAAGAVRSITYRLSGDQRGRPLQLLGKFSDLIVRVGCPGFDLTSDPSLRTSWLVSPHDGFCDLDCDGSPLLVPCDEEEQIQRHVLGVPQLNAVVGDTGEDRAKSGPVVLLDRR